MTQFPRQRPSVLLGSAASGGTIAAVRHLSANGIDVAVINSHPFCAAAWSRHARRRYSGPPESQSAQFLERLLAIGRADPGQLLLPTSDESVWLYTFNAALLGNHFRLYQPGIDTIRQILDKALLAEAASRAGLAVVPSWDPQTFDDLAALAPTLPYPVLIKPRTHVHRVRNDKGKIVYSADELRARYQQFFAREKYRSADTPTASQTIRPIIQRFVAVGRDGVVSVTGFIDRSGELFITRRSTKVLQRSRPVGVGVCFESRPNDPDLSRAVYRLCRELNYFGIFEVEFVRLNAGWAIIDFNPRMFNQMGMDLHRGMPLPLLAYLDALGEKDELHSAVARAQEGDGTQAVFSDRFTLRAILMAQALCLRARPKDLAYWRAWAKQNAAHTVDFAADASDPMPAVIHVLSEMYLGLRAAPRFLRAMLPFSPILARGL